MISKLSKILISLLLKLATEKFIKDMILLALRKISESTENKTDDEIYLAIERALNDNV